MKILDRKLASVWLSLGLGLASGCQTWVSEAGVTLPSPHYLRHPPQYIPPSGPFPLTNELKSMEDAREQLQAPQQAPGAGGFPQP
jgi:hypothetical protein